MFNDKNLADYQRHIVLATDLISQQMATVSQPFSGISPQELAAEFAAIDLTRPLATTEAALHELSQLWLRDAVWFHHPRYIAHLNCPITLPTLLAEQLLSAVNTSVDTWDQSAGATLIEQKVVDWTLNQIGLPQGSEGIFTSGGTQSNLMAMLLARDSRVAKQTPERLVKHHGLPAEASRWRIFTSALSHFSIQKSCALLGLGYEAVIPVDYDDDYKMDSAKLAQAMAKVRDEGLIPLAVVATAGTTDFGSIDSLTDIAELCHLHQVWFHVDAAYGCGLLTSTQHRHRLAGIELADSVTVDYHKSFFQSVSCGAFFVRDATHLRHVTVHADYLNPLSAKQEGTPNLVDKSLQTTRRFDALKMWLSLRIIGRESLGEAFDQVMALTVETHHRLVAYPQLEVLHAPELTTQVFRFHPTTELSATEVDDINQHIRKGLNRSGEAMIAATRVKGKQYLKFTLLNPTTSIDDIQQVIDALIYRGEALASHRLQSKQHAGAH
nr:aspartate aminotransferase family protein [Rosenbergiella gaditana]